MVECILNVSEGRRKSVLDELGEAVRRVPSVYLLDLSADPDHNRAVVTFAGDLPAVLMAAYSVIRVAIERIDLRIHSGVHPRVGAADVVPFVQLGETPRDEFHHQVRDLARLVGNTLQVPVFLYEKLATHHERKNLASLRRGGLVNLSRRMESDPRWQPDFGPSTPHPTAGVCIVGIRDPLVAFNILLQSDDLDLAREIASRVRERDGGLPGVKALGFYLEEKRKVQVSANLTDLNATSIRTLFERVQSLALARGVEVEASELIGLMPRSAWEPELHQLVKLRDFDSNRILENRLDAALARGGTG